MDLEDALTEVAEYYNPAEHEAARTIANEVWRLREELAAKTAAFEQLSNSIHLRSAREPLVQEVIRLRHAMYLLVERGAPEGILLDAVRNIMSAVDKLPEERALTAACAGEVST